MVHAYIHIPSTLVEFKIIYQHGCHNFTRKPTMTVFDSEVKVMQSTLNIKSLW